MFLDLLFLLTLDKATATSQYNPLEKLPVLFDENGKAVYESHFIMEWLEVKHPQTPLMPQDVEDRLFAKQVEVVTDGMQCFCASSMDNG